MAGLGTPGPAPWLSRFVCPSGTAAAGHATPRGLLLGVGSQLAVALVLGLSTDSRQPGLEDRMKQDRLRDLLDRARPGGSKKSQGPAMSLRPAQECKLSLVNSGEGKAGAANHGVAHT
jgi:hypothetical protein